MQRILSKLPKWELHHKNEDIRGWPLREANGRTVGTVSELIADTNTHCIAQVLLGDGRRFSAHDLWLGDHVLTFANAPANAESAALLSVAGAAAAAATGGNGNGGGSAASLASHTRAEPSPKAAPATLKNADVIIPIVDEEIEIGKRKVDAGGVRIRTRTVTKPFQEDVRLRDEHVSVERRRVDEPLSAADANTELRDRVFEVKATSELPVVAKRAHAVEEIVLKRERTGRADQVRDTVRHTEVEVVEIPSHAQRKPEARSQVK